MGAVPWHWERRLDYQERRAEGYLETANCIPASADWTGKATKTLRSEITSYIEGTRERAFEGVSLQRLLKGGNNWMLAASSHQTKNVNSLLSTSARHVEEVKSSDRGCHPAESQPKGF